MMSSRPGRAKRYRETPEVAAGAARMIRAVGARAAGDVDALPLLVDLGEEVERELRRAVAGVRRRGWSWTDVGRVLGTTRQAAQSRFGPWLDEHDTITNQVSSRP